MIKVGILGGGQLARMLALSGYPLNIYVQTYEPQAHPCAADVCAHTQGNFDDFEKLAAWVSACDVVTYETENIPADTLEFITTRKKIHPTPMTLPVIQDRYLEKLFCKELGIPTVGFKCFDTKEMYSCEVPCLIKTRRMGYDGKGQYLIRSQEQFLQTRFPDAPMIIEEFVSFDYEVSLIAVANEEEVLFYPLTLNHHQDGILLESHAPFIDVNLQQDAERIAKKMIQKLNYVGVIAIEFFVVKDKLLVNEVAPRVHNSGHWTIDAAVTSQFENHLRAITGMKLGDTAALCRVKMTNCIGNVPLPSQLMQSKDIKLHLYGKEARAGRKVGHYTQLIY